ncbi:CHAD domain-containing protein [Terrabacter sp. NPDC080008]|uniref:CHAD domain-containing protein n=1 Tax=Terrabacter sp. NPDC080008 TaxID=3155176 RepID=UPI00344E723D
MPSASVGTLVRQRLAEQRDALRDAEAAARAGDESGVHDLRVAMRRLRALLATYRPAFDPSVTEPVRTELEQASRELGQSRDAAVAVETVEALLQEAQLDGLDAEAVAGLRARLRLDASGTTDDVAETLGSTRWAAVVILVDELVSHPPLTDEAQRGARSTARERVRHEGRRFAERVDAARAAGPHELAQRLHEVRGAVKRLRYAAETAEPVAGKQVRAIRKQAKAVQARIGRHHDAVMTRATLRHLALDEAVGEGAAFLLGHLDADEQRALATLEEQSWNEVDALQRLLREL